MKTPVIRAVFFDVGGTLIHPWPSVGAVYARVGHEFGFHSTPEAMEESFRVAWKASKSAAPGRLTTGDKEWWRSLVFQALTIQGLAGSEGNRQAYFEALYAAFVQPDVWRIFPDVIETLTALRRQPIHVGIISNWDERLRPLLDRLGLAGYFDSLTISCEVGVEKPDAGIFQEAIRTAGVSAAEALHIGDSESEDGKGAAAAGVNFWLVRQAGNSAAPELPQVLDRLG